MLQSHEVWNSTGLQFLGVLKIQIRRFSDQKIWDFWFDVWIFLWKPEWRRRFFCGQKCMEIHQGLIHLMKVWKSSMGIQFKNNYLNRLPKT